MRGDRWTILAGTLVVSLASGCAVGVEPETAESEASVVASDSNLRMFPVPRQGAHVDVEADPARLACSLRVTTRGFDFPAGAGDPSVSETGKTMCFTLGPTVHCHVSGTETGFCRDMFDNVRNLLENRATKDGDFVRAYASGHPGHRLNVSGHSQGAYDASRVAPLLRAGDQLVLLQPASAAVVPNEALVDAAARGARVVVAWSPNDDASLLLRPLAGGRVPLLTFPRQEGIRVHNAPNARDLLHRELAVPDGYTSSPALDASILSNPGSPHDPAWRFPEWR
ncbi:MAG: hypothetical protein KIT84_36365 [Labilithrix sp.]|nr:hypothetical protein [Labilithrix sp.]MCW5816530.1 hypothetical protein [Labilithrix sp.]